MLVGIILACMYGMLLLYLTGQVFILLKQRHKKRSFKFGFNLLCFVWNLLRVVFWVLMALASNVDIPAFWLYFMWFGPHAVMYATFALLALFFVKLLAVDAWRPSWKLPTLATYWVTVVLDGGITALWIILAAHGANEGDDDENNSQLNNATNDESFTTATVFFFLGLLFLVFSVKMFSMESFEAHRLFVLEPKVSAAINLTLFVIFMSRSVYNFVSAMGWATVIVTSDSASDVILTIVMYTFWELFPTVLLLLTIARGKRGTKPVHEPNFGKFAVANIAESPKLSASAEKRHQLRSNLLLGGAVDVSVEHNRGRAGSLNDAIAQGDARYGAFQGNVFGVSPAWYASSGPSRGDPVPSGYASSGGQMLGSSDYANRSATWNNTSGYGHGAYGVSPAYGNMYAASPPMRTSSGRPPRDRSDTAGSATRARVAETRRGSQGDRQASGGNRDYIASSQMEGNARTRVESVLSESGNAQDYVFGNRNRYDTPPTHDPSGDGRWQQLPTVTARQEQQ